MSRAEIFLEFWVDLFRGMDDLLDEFVSFLAHYVGGGFDLWGDNTLFGFVGMALISSVYCFRQIWPNTEYSQGNLYDPEWTGRCAQECLDPSVNSTYDRFVRSLVGGAYLSFLTSFFAWPMLNFILGFFFGPVRT